MPFSKNKNHKMFNVPWLISSSIFLLSFTSVLCDFEMVILHTNDMHARFEETEKNSGTCKLKNKNKKCVGGFARIAHEVKHYRKFHKEGQEVLFLNAGDTFTGTVWYSAFKSKICSEFINYLEPDVICLGNHEFDQTPDGLAPFVDHVNCPVVSANLNFTFEPSLKKVQKSVILERSGKKIGVIGYLTPDTMLISSPRKTIFYDEVKSINEESKKLDAQGVKIILALGHSGFLMDKKIAEQVPLVDAVIGGHTNTFLWNGPQPDLEVVEAPYPKVITQPSGKKVPVVQAYAYTKYLGVLNLTFDDNGDLTNFGGQPILMSKSIPQDEDVLKLLEKYRPGIDAINVKIIGKSKVTLDGSDVNCRTKECNFGNLVADAYALYKHSFAPTGPVPIGLQNGGGIRTTIEPQENGDITYGEMLGAIPFDNQIISMKLNGSDIIKTLEIGARSQGETSRGEFLQVSGLKVVLDMSEPPFSRVVSVKVRTSSEINGPYEDIVLNKTYTVVSPSFLAVQGGDDHYILAQHGSDRFTEDLNDIGVIEWYFGKYSPVEPKLEGRITVRGSGYRVQSLTSLYVTMLTALYIYAL